MSTPGAARPPLAEEQRRLLNSWLTDLRQNWTETRLAVLVGQLPPPTAPWRLTALLELVKLDQQLQWQQGRYVTLADYLQRFPELARAEAAVSELSRAETELRRRVGSTTSPPTTRATAPHAVTFPTSRPAGGPGDLPEQFGRYRIVKRLGQGGMGTVYLAHDSALDRQVALKVPHFTPADGPEILERFYREARAAAGLQHPNICAIHDVGQVDGVHYLTMGYVEGKPLSAFLGGGKHMAPAKAAALVRQLALILHEAHARGVIHRDLKPSNIMIAAQGKPIIMDFGLARRLNSSDAPLTRGIMGTPQYMAPEQAAVDLAAMGPVSDVYSLGVILYELLTGKLPFEGPVAIVLSQLMTQEPPPPSRWRPGLDPSLEAICLKAMAKAPAARYASMQDFARALAEWSRTQGSATEPQAPLATLVPVAQVADPQTYRAGAAPTHSGSPQPATLPAAPPAPAAPPPPGRRWLPFVAAVVLLGLVVGAVVHFSRSGGGTKPGEQGSVRIQIDDPKVTVFLTGDQERAVEPGQVLNLPAGQYQLVVKYGDVVIETRPLSIQPGDNPAQSVTHQAPIHAGEVWRGVYGSPEPRPDNNPHILMEVVSRAGDAFEGTLYASENPESRKGLKIKGRLVADSVTFDIDPEDKKAGPWAGFKFSGKVERREHDVVFRGAWDWGGYRHVYEMTLRRPEKDALEAGSLWDGVYDWQPFTVQSPRMLLEVKKRQGRHFEAVVTCPTDTSEGARTGLSVKGQVLAGVVWFNSDADKRVAKDWAGLQFTGTLEQKAAVPFLKGGWIWGGYGYKFELKPKRGPN